MTISDRYSQVQALGDWEPADDMDAEADNGCPDCGALPGAMCNTEIKGRTIEVGAFVHAARLQNL